MELDAADLAEISTALAERAVRARSRARGSRHAVEKWEAIAEHDRRLAIRFLAFTPGDGGRLELTVRERA